MKFGIVADDDTGASDAAGMLTAKGVPTVLFLGPPDSNTFQQLGSQYDACAVATQSRSIDPRAAYRNIADVTRLFRDAGLQKVQLKYCSTFDSTPKGNIGPMMDAAVDVLEVAATVACPALPVNGRTTYMGYHFVHGQLLSESPLKDHPLHPMTDSNLVRWLKLQTTRAVASVTLPVIRTGPAALGEHLDRTAARDIVYFITDAIDQSDLTTIARATADWPLITGGSGITGEIPDLLFPDRPDADLNAPLARCAKTVLTVAGSCAPATRAQNALAAEQGFHAFAIPGDDCLTGRIDPARIARDAAEMLARGENVLVHASAAPAEVQRVQKLGKSLGLSATGTGRRIADTLAEITDRVLRAQPPGRLVLAGGETANAACTRLGVRALAVGRPIDPGVPCCFPLERDDIAIVLKSGNFGAEDLYLKVRDL